MHAWRSTRIPSKVYNLTIKRNCIAVVSDENRGGWGSETSVRRAAMPVMEGKAMLFKEFGGVDAFPVCLDTKDPDEIVRTVKAISPGLAGINLEDISAPRWRLRDRRAPEARVGYVGIPR